MKKLIQVFSLLSLVFVFTAVSASAQSEYGSEVEIPFSFNVGDRSYEPGKYIVKLSKTQSSSAILNISDPNAGTVQTVFARRNGAQSDEDFKLVFETVDGGKVLSSVITPSGGFALRMRRQPRNVSTLNPTPNTVHTNTTGDLF